MTGRASTIASPLREVRRLDAGRALAWARVLAVLAALAVLALAVDTRGGTVADSWGRPLATDFSSFWTAGRLALSGAPASAWDPVAHAEAQRRSFPARDGYAGEYYAFFYPPPFLLVCLPLALLPYGAAAALWLALTNAGYLAAMRALLPRRWPASLTALAFPAVLLNAEHGQNGALSAALLGVAAGQLDRRPRLAGVCLGLLCAKPQLALLVVPALIAARRLRALAWAGLAAVGASLAAWLAFGGVAWRGFVANSALARSVLEGGLVGYAKMASVFAAARLLGAGVAVAWTVQALASAAALAAVVVVARRRPGAAAEVSVLAAAACVATPFLLDYDLMVLAVPLAWMAAPVARDECRPWEKLACAAAFALPLLARPVALQAGVPIAVPMTATLLCVVARRAAGRKQAWALPRPARGEPPLDRLDLRKGSQRRAFGGVPASRHGAEPLALLARPITVNGRWYDLLP